MNKINQVKNIQFLTAKIRQLQEELCFRTRNYLYQNSSNRKRQLETKSKIVQTQQQPPHPEQTNNKNKESTVCKSYFVFQQSYTPQKHDRSNYKTQSPISQFIEEQTPPKPNRNHQILQKLQQQRQQLKQLSFQQQSPFTKLQKSMISQPDDEHLLAQPQSNNNNNSNTISKARRKLYKEIKQLRRRLQIEENMNKYMRKGLMISEEQNYQFRLKIKKLEKIVDRINDPMRQSQSMSEVSSENFDETIRSQKLYLYEQQLAHQKKVKEEYLQSLLIAQDKVSTLQQQLQKVSKEYQQIGIQLQKMKNRAKKQQSSTTNGPQNLQIIQMIDNSTNDTKNNPQPQQQQQPILQKEEQKKDKEGKEEGKGKGKEKNEQWLNSSFLQSLKQKAYSISNCIPVVNDTKDVNLFMPETQAQIMTCFGRIQQYCQNIEKWQHKRLDQLQQIKNMFVQFIKKIAELMDNQTKETISRQIIKDQKIGYLLKIFKPSPTTTTTNSNFNSLTTIDFPSKNNNNIPENIKEQITHGTSQTYQILQLQPNEIVRQPATIFQDHQKEIVIYQ